MIGLNVFTVGGVIAAGQTLMDIVPDKADLVVGVRVAIEDADDLRVGQKAQVRFLSLHERNMPIIFGQLTRLSADAWSMKRPACPITPPKCAFRTSRWQSVESMRGGDFALRAGAPVAVLIPLKKRTALQYAFEPLTDTMWKAFREN